MIDLLADAIAGEGRLLAVLVSSRKDETHFSLLFRLSTVERDSSEPFLMYCRDRLLSLCTFVYFFDFFFDSSWVRIKPVRRGQLNRPLKERERDPRRWMRLFFDSVGGAAGGDVTDRHPIHVRLSSSSSSLRAHLCMRLSTSKTCTFRYKTFFLQEN